MATRRGKTALVLAGGGLTGAVYEIGALRAIDHLLVDRTVTGFDIYVGTSAGVLVCAGLANGLGPETMLQIFDGSHTEMRPVEPRDIFHVNARELLRRVADLPGVLWNAGRHYGRHKDDMTLFDLVWFLLEALPAGLYDGLALERYVRSVLSSPGLSNRFDDLARELYIIMRYSIRLTVARHGCESVTMDLAEDYAFYKASLARHGIPLSRRLVIAELAEIQQSGYDPAVIGRVLEARSAGCNRGRKGTPVCHLTRALAELELALDALPQQA